MLLTTLYGLKKPQANDIADLRVFVGDNMDILEAKISEIEATMLVSVDWVDVTGKPAFYEPVSHTHAWEEIMGVPPLDNYQGWNISVDTISDRISSLETLNITSSGHTIVDYNASNNTLNIHTVDSPNFYLTEVTGVANSLITFKREGLPDITWNSLHYHTWDDIQNKPTMYTPISHQHTWSSIISRPSTFPPSTHTHLWVDITDKPTTFTPSSHTHSFIDLTDRPTEFTPIAHTHFWSEIIDKPATFTPVEHTHDWNEITNVPNIVQQSDTAGTGNVQKLWTGTEEQYNNIETKDSSTIYYIVG